MSLAYGDRFQGLAARGVLAARQQGVDQGQSAHAAQEHQDHQHDPGGQVQARGDAQGQTHSAHGGARTMPVHFKAAEDGTYTLTVSTTINSQLSTLNYLHLVDNMTGADVDLLTPPACGHPLTEGDVPLLRGQGGFNKPATYTFTAKTTDYESRFKLVFSVGGDANDDNADAPFAFINNGNIIVNGEGTLQVMDVMGRVIVQRDVETSYYGVSTTGMTAGVYVLRLINGDVVKTQKIVIE